MRILPPRTGSRNALTKVLLRALTAIASVCMLLSCSGEVPDSPRDLPRDGPMAVPEEHGTLARGPMGTRFTDGFDVLYLGGEETARIISVESVGEHEGLEFEGALIAGPDRRFGAFSQLEGFPPVEPRLGDVIEAAGAEIRPASQTRNEIGYELLLGYEVSNPSQVWYRTEIRVTYEVGDTEYLYVSPSQLVYCPDAMTSDECNDEVGRS